MMAAERAPHLIWRTRVVAVAGVVVFLALAAGGMGWVLLAVALAGLIFAGRALTPRIRDYRAVTARRQGELRDRADRQHRWMLRGDSRGVYGPAGAALMASFPPEPHLDAAGSDTEDPQIAAMATTPDDLDTLLAEKPLGWSSAAFASVLAQRRAAIQSRLRDQELGFAPARGERVDTAAQVHQVVIDLLEDMDQIMDQVAALLDSPATPRMFGASGTEDTADGDGIVHLANRLMDLHERLLCLAERCRGLRAPTACADLLRDCGHLLDAPLEGFRQFLDEFVERVEELPASGPVAVGPIIVDPVELDMPVSDELMSRVFEQLEAIRPG